MTRDQHPELFPRRIPEPEVGQVVIHLQGLHKAFNGQIVLDGIDLTFKHGQTTVVIGRSGCGKSVLLKHIIGLLRPDAGRVIIFDQDLSQLNRRRLELLRMQFGMVFQGSALFDSLDVNDNVGFLLYEHSKLKDRQIREIVSQRLAMVGLEAAENKMPEELSGGMKKRVALARAIVGDPHVILYDEPTTGLDPVTADTINDLIIKTQRELRTTSIVVTHDMASANKIADRIIMLHEGQIIIDDTPEGVARSNDLRVQSFIHGDASLGRGDGSPGGQS
ncbi:MAG: ATP-binding cassette domain-containing protein [Anaerolineaceae bacterium]|nr:ATP-binding cassette domain-containing protein [Anaerolineaceae bacterium]